MYCANCGSERKGDEKFCSNCGKPFVDKQAEKPKSNKKPSYGILGAFHISEDDLNLQVEQHDSLPFSKTSRGIAVMTIIGLLIIGTLLGLVLAGKNSANISFSDIFWSLVIYAPLLYFVYRGHLWAVVALGLWYTVDKFYTAFVLSPTHFNIGTIIFWIIGIGPLWVAFKVEREYRKRKMRVATT